MWEDFSIVTREYLLKMLQPVTISTIIALVLLVVLLVAISKKTTLNTRTLAYGAIAISIAFILSYLRLFKMPYGGTITLASMLPIFIFAYIAGPRAGLLAGLCYGMLQFIQEPYLVHPVQFLLDYPLAFGFLGLAGFFKDRVYIGAAVGGAARLLCHFISGVVFLWQLRT
jgi:thiamine transporter